MQRYRIATHQKTYADIIREDAVPDVGYVLFCHQLPMCLFHIFQFQFNICVI